MCHVPYSICHVVDDVLDDLFYARRQSRRSLASQSQISISILNHSSIFKRGKIQNSKLLFSYPPRVRKITISHRETPLTSREPTREPFGLTHPAPRPHLHNRVVSVPHCSTRQVRCVAARFGCLKTSEQAWLVLKGSR